MKFSKILHRFALVLSLSLPVVALAPALVAAQQPPSPVIIVIDMQEVLRKSTAVQDVQKQIEQTRSSYQSELQTKEKELREADQELSRQRTILSSEAFAEKRRGLEEQLAGFQRDIGARKQMLEKSFAQGMRQIEAQLIKIADDIAAERGANLVLPKSNVLLVHPDFEATDEALKRLNSALPAMKLPAN
jgi:Skp family chaperone for outer membrane proteins